MSDSLETFSAASLGGFGMSFTNIDSGLVDLLPPPVNMTYDMLFFAGDVPAKAVIGSMADMQRLHAGESVEVKWYIRKWGIWYFVERRPLQINREGKAE